jgi:hypothetical protein
MLIVVIGLGVFFSIIGFVVTEKNAQYLLSGYNTLSKEDQEKFPLALFLKRFKRFHLRLGVLYIVLGIALNYLSKDWLGYHMGITPIVAYLYFIFVNRSIDPQINGSSTKVGIGVLVGVLFLVIALFYWSERENTIVMKADSIEISGPYGCTIPFSHITGINLTDEIPEIRRRKHGIATGGISKGRFIDVDGNEVLLLIDHPASNYITIERSSNIPVIISLSNVNEELVADSLLTCLSKVEE